MYQEIEATKQMCEEQTEGRMKGMQEKLTRHMSELKGQFQFAGVCVFVC